MTNNNEEIINDNYIIYMREIADLPQLTDEETNLLFIDYKNGNIDAKKKIIDGHLHMVVAIAKEYLNDNLELLDLIQEGNLALQRAVETFDLEKNIKFTTYAYRCICNRIISFIRDNRLIAIPKHRLALLKKIDTYRNNFYAKYGFYPKSKYIGTYFGLTEMQVNEILNLPMSYLSLNDRIMLSDDKVEVQDCIEDTHFDVEEMLLEKEYWENLRKNEVITSLEEDILISRLNLYNQGIIPYRELSHKYSLSTQTLRAKKEKALNKIRNEYQRKKIGDILENESQDNKTIDINLMNKISFFMINLSGISSRNFFEMVKKEGLLQSVLACFSVGYLDTSKYTIDEIADVLEIESSLLEKITKEIHLTFKHENKIK